MRPFSPALRAASAAAIALLALSACTSPQSASTPAAAGASAEQAPSSGQSSTNSGQSSETSATPLIIDVRTPEEFAAGHLDGAVNIDATAADFSERIAELDPKGAYTLYCRSGNRAARAAELMTAAGFTEVRNAGGLEEAAKSLGLPIVTDWPSPPAISAKPRIARSPNAPAVAAPSYRQAMTS